MVKGAFSRLAGQLDITVSKDPDEPNATAITFVRKATFDQADRTAVGYILRTRHTNWEEFPRSIQNRTQLRNFARETYHGRVQLGRHLDCMGDYQPKNDNY